MEECGVAPEEEWEAVQEEEAVLEVLQEVDHEEPQEAISEVLHEEISVATVLDIYVL